MRTRGVEHERSKNETKSPKDKRVEERPWSKKRRTNIHGQKEAVVEIRRWTKKGGGQREAVVKERQ
jgi:hypothetical protein